MGETLIRADHRLEWKAQKCRGPADVILDFSCLIPACLRMVHLCEGDYGGPLLLGRCCTFDSKKAQFKRPLESVIPCEDRDKKGFACHGDLDPGRCTFVRTKVKRPGRRAGGLWIDRRGKKGLFWGAWGGRL